MKIAKKQTPLVKAILTTAALIALSAIAWYIYRQNHHVVPETVNSTALMAVTSEGGMCAHGCSHAIYNLYPDGRFDGHKNLSKAEVSRLSRLIDDTDFLKYPDKGFASCESIVDGSDQVLIFPQKYGDKHFTTCMLSIPAADPFFSYFDQLLSSHPVN